MTASDVPGWYNHPTIVKQMRSPKTKISVLGIDLAKQAFQLHGVDEQGQAVLRKKLTRSKLLAFIAQLEPCLIGLEACSSSHYWAREIQRFGHDVRLISPQFVKPYVTSNKHDAADAEAICEAVSRPNMSFVPIKGIEQQDMWGAKKGSGVFGRALAR